CAAWHSRHRRRPARRSAPAPTSPGRSTGTGRTRSCASWRIHHAPLPALPRDGGSNSVTGATIRARLCAPLCLTGGSPMYEKEVIVTTKYGQMPSFVACPDGPGQASQYPAVIFYMDAPGIREELRNMTRRIAKQGYFAVLPDMYYRLPPPGLALYPRRTAVVAWL